MSTMKRSSILVGALTDFVQKITKLTLLPHICIIIFKGLAWVNFVKSVQSLLVPQMDDRPLDQYLEFRNTVLELVQRNQFLNDLNNAWPSPNDPPLAEVRNAILMELKAFPRAVEVANAIEKPDGAKVWGKRC
jgi:hypothetical protein